MSVHRMDPNKPITPLDVVEKVWKAARGPLGWLVKPLLVAVALLVLLPTSRAIFCVNILPGEIGVKQNSLTGGGIIEEDMAPGYHLRVPGMHRIYTLEEHYHFLDFSGQNRLRIRTGDTIISLDVSVPYRIIPGRGHNIVQDGLHVGDAYQDRTRNTTIGVLREHLAGLSAREFFNTDDRLRITQVALDHLNPALEQFHTEAERVFIRAVFYQEVFEQQQQSIQLMTQEALLDVAQREVAQDQQELDNFNQETAGQENSRNAWWDHKLAVLDRVFMVGFRPADLGALVDATLVGLGDAAAEGEDAAEIRRTLTAEIERTFSGEAFELGIEGIRADTDRQVATMNGRANAMQGRFQAQADQLIAEIEFERERRINELLSSAGGRSLVALEAAQRLQFSTELVFHANQVPFIFNLEQIARLLMGQTE